jgi:outer membrane protein OmpA-like peptidoglycan-associated protein
MTRKSIALAAVLSTIFARSSAQELGIELNGGLQGMQYSLQNGTVRQLPAGSLGLTYGFRLGRHLHLLTGLSGGIYRTQASLGDSAVYSSGQVDDAGSAFLYNVKATGYKETQEFVAASVPLLLQYHTGGPRTRWYLDLGGRAMFPLTASVHQSARQLSLSGYYPDYNIDVSNLPQHGFGTYTNWTSTQTVTLKPAAILSASTGLSFRLSRGSRLYTGVYLDYGLTTLKSANDSMPLVSYNSGGGSQVQANSVLKMPISGQATLLSYGVQLRVSFGPAGAQSAAKSGPKQERQNPADSALGEYEAKIIKAPVIFGALGETTIPDVMKTHLDDVVAILLQNPGIRVTLVGHICNSMTETEDAEIGLERARAVARYLHSKGISRRRMDIRYLQESDPVLPNNPAANYRNRKVMITVQ